MNSAIGQKAIKGTFWMLCSFGLAKAAAFASSIVLARLLFPEDFGVFALAGTVIGVVAALGDLGTGAAVIYEERSNSDHTNSAFWIGLSTGALQSVAIASSSQWMSELYGQAMLRDVLMLLSVVPVIGALGQIHQTLLAKELRFGAKAALELLPGVCSAVVSIASAALGFGVWSLVFGMIVGITFPNILAWWFVPWRPSLRISLTEARAVIGYGKALLGMGALIFLTDNVDYMIVGRILGASPLGLYSQAFRLATYPETTIVWPVEKVAFPTFSRLRDNKQALHSAFLKTIQYLALVSFPLLTLLLILSQQFVLTLYGSKWEGMILPLQILCILGMSRSVTAVSKQMLMAVGRPDITLKCNLVVLPAATGGVFVGTWFGIAGVAIAMTAFLSVGAWALLLLTSRQIDLPFKRVIYAIQPAVATSLFLFVCFWLVQRFVSDAFSAVGLWNLTYSVLLGSCLFVLSLVLFNRQTLAEALAIATWLRGKRDDEVSISLVR